MNTDKIYAEAIANEYSVKKAPKVIQLKKLDKKVKQTPLIIALTIGIISTLIMGTGMCFALGALTLGSTVATMTLGIVLGVIGIIGAVANYFIYTKMLTTRKSKYANDIIALAKEISEE